MVSRFFSDFNYRKLRKCTKPLLIEKFKISFEKQRDLDLMNALISSNHFNINTVVNETLISIEGEPEQTGIL